MEENAKSSPEKGFSPRSYSADDESSRSWQSSATEDSSHCDNYAPAGKSPSFDTVLETSQPLSYTESCDTYKSSAAESFEAPRTVYTRPETPYNRFLERLKHPSCVDIVSAVKGLVPLTRRLVVMLPGNMPRSEAANVAHNFIDIYTPKLLALSVFAALSDDEKAETVESFEKFTMQKLYPQ